MPAKRKDLTGLKFGKLTVLSYSYNNRHAYWNCQCDCGKHTIVRSSHLISGLIKSCGCLVKEVNRKNIKIAQIANTIHGETRVRLHNIWCNMRQRCSDVNSPTYSNYGGRGISVCKEWEESYLNFRSWALANGYRDDLSIDRIDVNGNYCPENCRWANKETQANNTRKNVFVTYDGITKSVSQWAREFGISLTTFRRWLKSNKEIERSIRQ